MAPGGTPFPGTILKASAGTWYLPARTLFSAQPASPALALGTFQPKLSLTRHLTTLRVGCNVVLINQTSSKGHNMAWIFLPGGLLMPASVPMDKADAALTRGYRDLQVRARVRSHLTNFIRDYMEPMGLDYSQIVATPGMDYNFRFYTRRAEFATALSSAMLDIDYETVKPTAADKDEKGVLLYADGKAYHGVLNSIWSTLTRLGAPGGKWAGGTQYSQGYSSYGGGYKPSGAAKPLGTSQSSTYGKAQTPTGSVVKHTTTTQSSAGSLASAGLTAEEWKKKYGKQGEKYMPTTFGPLEGEGVGEDNEAAILDALLADPDFDKDILEDEAVRRGLWEDADEADYADAGEGWPAHIQQEIDLAIEGPADDPDMYDEKNLDRIMTIGRFVPFTQWDDVLTQRESTWLLQKASFFDGDYATFDTDAEADEPLVQVSGVKSEVTKPVASMTDAEFAAYEAADDQDEPKQEKSVPTPKESKVIKQKTVVAPAKDNTPMVLATAEAE